MSGIYVALILLIIAILCYKKYSKHSEQESALSEVEDEIAGVKIESRTARKVRELDGLRKKMAEEDKKYGRN